MRKTPFAFILAAGAASLAAADRPPAAAPAEKGAVAIAAGENPEPAREVVTFLGVEAVSAPAELVAQLRLPEGQGLVVRLVVPDSPAATAGLKRHDLLTRLDDQILVNPQQLAVLVRSHREGDTVALAYIRAGSEMKTSAVLASHEAPRDRFMWFGGEAPPAFESHMAFPLPEEFDEHVRETIGRGIRRGFMATPAPTPHARAGTRVMVYHPNVNIVMDDESGSLELRSEDDRHVLTARGAGGEVVFSGPVDTEEQRAALPGDLRERLEKLEKIEAVAPEPPEPPEAPMAPPAPPPPAAPAGGVTVNEIRGPAAWLQSRPVAL